MLVLDQGFLGSYPCGSRMGIVFAGALAAQAAMLAAYVVATRWPENPVEMLNRDPFVTRRNCIIFAIWLIVSSLVAVVCMWSRTETLLAMDANFIVETSCEGPFSGEYLLDRAKTRVSYITETTIGHTSMRRAEIPNWYGYRRREENYLELTEPGKDRTLYVQLDNSRNLANLAELSPRAISSYMDYKRDRKINGFPKPATIPQLEPPFQKIVRRF
ncbi:hypothetical protein FHT86_004110 [Rhizobium sp. BK313]|jgi:hypothetical protein|uniref:hypothetical protein n=1 Tax=Rhizobium sp. BK313 TaxID=2587081 RepID=UPI001060A47A|nr:hypothetical protein [Rhizobium sp. BK313]MBB3455811.1 hypothetical protein [Rhizobium sp. BK313]